MEGKTDWQALAAKTDEEVLRAAESDPDAQPLTAEQLAQAHRVPDRVDVRAVRMRHKMSQSAFAQRYGFDLDVLEAWEQGRRPLDRYVKILLTVIDKEPEAVERALAV
jgi:putative transcriptional regulator